MKFHREEIMNKWSPGGLIKKSVHISEKSRFQIDYGPSIVNADKCTG